MAGFTNSAISFPSTIKVGTFIVDGNEIARLPVVLQKLKKESNPSEIRIDAAFVTTLLMLGCVYIIY